LLFKKKRYVENLIYDMALNLFIMTYNEFTLFRWRNIIMKTYFQEKTLWDYNNISKLKLFQRKCLLIFRLFVLKYKNLLLHSTEEWLGLLYFYFSSNGDKVWFSTTIMARLYSALSIDNLLIKTLNALCSLSIYHIIR